MIPLEPSDLITIDSTAVGGGKRQYLIMESTPTPDGGIEYNLLPDPEEES